MNRQVQRFMLRAINCWPPFLADGIHVRWGADYRSAHVEMRLRPWNRNYVGTHYGGSLYSMTDPFYMLMLMENLGRDYIVWDKAASIRFRKPGRGTVRAEFRLTEQQLADIRGRLVSQDKYEPVFQIEVRDEADNLIAEVEKIIHIRRKPGLESKPA
jgi:acyl-coenzyme A thioesterase PaaI-like protein